MKAILQTRDKTQVPVSLEIDFCCGRLARALLFDQDLDLRSMSWNLGGGAGPLMLMGSGMQPYDYCPYCGAQVALNNKATVRLVQGEQDEQGHNREEAHDGKSQGTAG